MKQRVAILSRSHDRSPKILAMGLQDMLRKNGYTADIYYDGIGLLSRLFSIFKPIYNQIRLHYRIRQKIRFLTKDRKLIKKLKTYDLIVLSECIPNAYWRGYYAIEELKVRTCRPIALYEVYYLGNSIFQYNELVKGHHHGLERFDWNFSVSEITEKKLIPSYLNKWSVVGLNLTCTGLVVREKEEFIVVVDFEQVGYEESRKDQLEVLAQLGIKTISLEGSYSLE